MLYSLKNSKSKNGFTLIEVLVSASIVALTFVVLTAAIDTYTLLKRSKMQTQATLIAESALEAIRDLPFEEITDRTDASFMNMAFNWGRPQTVADVSAPSAPNTLELRGGGITLDDIESLALLPAGAYGTSTIETSFKILNSSPSNWEAGVVFGYQDSRNHYRLRVQPDEAAIEKVVSGTATVLSAQPVILNKNVWYTLKVTFDSPSISILLNDAPAGSASDATFSARALGLIAWNGTSGYFDNLSLDGAQTEQFDTTEVKKLPANWERFGLADLPEGQGFVTIAPWNGLTNAKLVTARVTWREFTQHSVSISSIISAY